MYGIYNVTILPPWTRHFCECTTSTTYATMLTGGSQKQDRAAKVLEVNVSPQGMLQGRQHLNPNFPGNLS